MTRTALSVEKRREWDRAYRQRLRQEKSAARRGELLPDESWCPSCHMRWRVPPAADRDWSGLLPEPTGWERTRWEHAADAFDRISDSEGGEKFTAREFLEWVLAPVGVVK